MIGICPGRGPRGSCGRSRAACHVPSKSAWPSRSRGTITRRASSNRSKMWSSGSPNAWACPGHACPAPSPKMKRPPLISSSVSAVLAMIPGLRWSADITQVPTLARNVIAATAPAMETPSQAPITGGPRGAQELVRGPERVEPDLLASTRDVADLRPARCHPRRPDCTIGRTIPISNERMATSGNWRDCESSHATWRASIAGGACCAPDALRAHRRHPSAASRRRAHHPTRSSASPTSSVGM
jgi:hypothetical protein